MKLSIGNFFVSLSLIASSVLGLQTMGNAANSSVDQAASTGDKSVSNPAVDTASATQAKSKLVLDVHRDPNCGCCGHWVEHMQQAGV